MEEGRNLYEWRDEETNEPQEALEANAENVVESEQPERVSQAKTSIDDKYAVQTESFFKDIIRFQYDKEKLEKFNIAFIVVSHAVYDLKLFLKALEEIGKIGKIIFKGSSKNESIYEEIEKIYGKNICRYSDRVLDKSLFMDWPERIKEVYESIKCDYKSLKTQRKQENIEEFIDEDVKIIIIDIGGYFAPCVPIISKELNDVVLGIVEDTENGHQKYEKYIHQSAVPVFSVARCQQKRTEDYNVGRSIVETANSLLKDIQVRIVDSTCGVIGFGKIGSSIAETLRRDNRDPFVCDHNPIISMRAASLDFNIAAKEDILKNCDIIFCATGKKSLSQIDLDKIQKEKVYIASCTSADDEFSCKVSDFEKSESGNLSVYKNTSGKEISFLANGNAVNFSLQNNALGNYIRSVQSAILVSAMRLINKRFSKNFRCIHEISEKEEEVISKLWLKYFSKKTYRIENNFLFKNNAKQSYINDAYIEEIESNLTRYNYSILYGESGVGKTEAAKKVAIKNQDYYDFLWYVDNKKKDVDINWQELGLRTNTLYSIRKKADFFRELFAQLCYQKNFLLIIDSIGSKDGAKGIVSSFLKALRNKRENTFGYRSHVVLVVSDEIANDQASLEVKPLTEKQFDSVFSKEDKRIASQSGKIYNLTKGYPFLIDKVVSYILHSVPLFKFNITESTVDLRAFSGINLTESDDVSTIQQRIIEVIIKKLKTYRKGKREYVCDALKFTLALGETDCIYPEVYSQFFASPDDKSYCLNILVNYGLLEKWDDATPEAPFCMRELTREILGKLSLGKRGVPFAPEYRHKKAALLAFDNLFQYKPYGSKIIPEKYYVYASQIDAFKELLKNSVAASASDESDLLSEDNLLDDSFKTQIEKDPEKQEVIKKIMELFIRLGNFYLYEHRGYLDSCQPFYFAICWSKLCLAEENAYERMVAMHGLIVNAVHNEKSDSEDINQTTVERFEEWLLAINRMLERIVQDPLASDAATYDSLVANMYISESYIHKYLAISNIKAGKFLEVEKYLSLSLISLKNAKTKAHEDYEKSLLFHAFSTLYLKIYLLRKKAYIQGHSGLGSDCLKKSEDRIRQAIKIRAKCLNEDDLDLARSRYQLSKVLYKQYRHPEGSANFCDNKEKLGEAWRNCQLAISAQEKRMWFWSANLRDSHTLASKVECALKEINKFKDLGTGKRSGAVYTSSSQKAPYKKFRASSFDFSRIFLKPLSRDTKDRLKPSPDEEQGGSTKLSNQDKKALYWPRVVRNGGWKQG